MTAIPDPYNDSDVVFRLDDKPYPEFEAFRELWRRGSSLDALHPDGPFALRGSVGPYKENLPGDVAKVESLLHDTGYFDANDTDGPTGIYSRILMDGPIKKFQADHDLAVDGYLDPDGETIARLGTLLGPHSARNPFDASPEAMRDPRALDPDEMPTPSVAQEPGTQVAAGSKGRSRSGWLRDLPAIIHQLEQWRKDRAEELKKRPGTGDVDQVPPTPAQPPFAPGELQSPGFPSKPPIDPEEFNTETIPAEPVVVSGTVFPIIDPAKPQILIFPDLSGEIEQIFIAKNQRPDTKAQLLELAKKLAELNPDFEHKGGASEKEEYLPNPAKDFEGVGRKGSNYSDLTFKHKYSKLRARVQTVDIDRHGKPTQREWDNALRIFKRTRESIFLIPKTHQMEEWERRNKRNPPTND